MEIRIRLFAGIREAVGISQETLHINDAKTVGDVRRLLQKRGGAWAEALAESRTVRIACNHEMVGAERLLTDGCEVAFFPPVTGG